MAMSREEQDAFDRRMAGIMDPRDPMADTLRGMAGGPIASYSMSDLRRLLGLGAPGSPAPAVDAAEMYQQLRTAPAAMAGPSATPEGAQQMPVAVPVPPPPRPTSPARPFVPRGSVMPGTMPATPEVMPMGGIVPPATPGAAPVAVEPMLPPIPPVPLVNPNRVDPQMLARALMRGARPPIGNEMAALPPGSEMQVGPAPLGGMPVEAQADQTMRSVSRVDPQSFGNRFRGTMMR